MNKVVWICIAFTEDVRIAEFMLPQLVVNILSSGGDSKLNDVMRFKTLSSLQMKTVKFQ